jgi:hypothetical protein
MRTKLGGVGGRFDVSRSTNADSDIIHPHSHVATSSSRATTARPSNAAGPPVVCRQHEQIGWFTGLALQAVLDEATYSKHFDFEEVRARSAAGRRRRGRT